MGVTLRDGYLSLISAFIVVLGEFVDKLYRDALHQEYLEKDWSGGGNQKKAKRMKRAKRPMRPMRTKRTKRRT
jgi:hypothetical protein